MVGAVGLMVIAVGIFYLYEAYQAKFQRHFEQHQMTQTERKWAKWIGQFGIAARGIMFDIIGLFLVLAALHANASEAKGLDGVLTVLSQQMFGRWLLGTVSLGLISYSIYLLIEARYRRIIQPHE
jgi:fructose-specific phosphotransferase system IIC component